MAANIQEKVAVGRRKCAVARVRLTPGTGKMTINGRPVEEYLAREVLVMVVNQPFVLTSNSGKYDAKVLCDGGGVSGQADAISLGVSRALTQFDENLVKPLRKAGLLTRDARAVERKKYGQPGARKRFQFSKR